MGEHQSKKRWAQKILKRMRTGRNHPDQKEGEQLPLWRNLYHMFDEDSDFAGNMAEHNVDRSTLWMIQEIANDTFSNAQKGIPYEKRKVFAGRQLIRTTQEGGRNAHGLRYLDEYHSLMEAAPLEVSFNPLVHLMCPDDHEWEIISGLNTSKKGYKEGPCSICKYVIRHGKPCCYCPECDHWECAFCASKDRHYRYHRGGSLTPDV